MDFLNKILQYSFLIYFLIILSVIILIGFLYVFVKIKNKKSKVKFIYKGYKFKLVTNTLGVKKSMYWLLKKDFRKIIEEENQAVGIEIAKPFDFTKIRESNVLTADLLTALAVIVERL